MRLWSSRLLEAELADGRLSEWEKVKYLLLPIILSALIGGPVSSVMPRYGPEPPAFDWLRTILGGVAIAVVSYYGIRMGYRRNQLIDGRHFIERYTVLYVPILIKFSVVLAAGLVVLMAVCDALGLTAATFNAYAPAILTCGGAPVLLLLYYLVARSISRYGDQLKRMQTNTSAS